MLPESGHTGCDRRAGLDFGLLGDLKRIIYLDTKVSDRAFQLGMAKQELNGSEVLRALVDQCGLGTSHRVCPVGR